MEPLNEGDLIRWQPRGKGTKIYIATIHGEELPGGLIQVVCEYKFCYAKKEQIREIKRKGTKKWVKL